LNAVKSNAQPANASAAIATTHQAATCANDCSLWRLASADALLRMSFTLD
jgi:hypothetical protein